MIVIKVYTVVGGVLVAMFAASTITLILNWANRLRNELSDPDAYTFKVDAECFRN